MPALYLLRHGIARPEGGDPALSDEGEIGMREEARGMASLGLAFDVILTSPLQRAVRTAQIVAEVLGPPSGPLVSDLLAPGCLLSSLDDLFVEHRGARAILLVGHQPDMGRIAADLIEAEETLPLDRGALCGLEVRGWPPQPPATLARILSPASLRRGNVR